MTDMLQAFTTRRIVEAHGKRYVTLYNVGENSRKKFENIYLAVDAAAETFPAPVVVIAVDETPSKP